VPDEYQGENEKPMEKGKPVDEANYINEGEIF
jgi:hypothetical protein